MNDLVVNKVEISTDDEGRFSLNDLHKAAGGDKKYQPNLFLAIDRTKEEVEFLTPDLSGFSPVIRKAGRYGGTWVCRELVYSYAMWVSVEFRINVIRAFDAMVTGSKPPATMEYFNQVVAKCESDKEAASAHGRALAGYREIKKDNKAKVDGCIRTLQWTLDL